MARILTITESDETGDTVAREVAGLGIAVDRAATPDEGLLRLASGPFELVLLDLALHGAEGASMLVKMRELGHRTPVLILAAAAKSSVVLPAVTPLLKLGVEGFVVKPPKPGELAQRIRRALRLSPSTAIPRPKLALPPAPYVATGAPVIAWVLLVDELESVAHALRALLPPGVSLDSAPGPVEALARCRERAYRIVFIDAAQDDNSGLPELTASLRAVLPSAAIVLLALRTASDAERATWASLACGILGKPFDADEVRALVVPLLGEGDHVEVSGNVARVLAREPAMPPGPRLVRLEERLARFLVRAAQGCFPSAVVDLTRAPVLDDLPRLVDGLAAKAQLLGIELRVVGQPAPVGAGEMRP